MTHCAEAAVTDVLVDGDEKNSRMYSYFSVDALLLLLLAVLAAVVTRSFEAVMRSVALFGSLD